ncbi:DUF6587 family protein [Acinetobacter sp. B51(2017)]|uniref:DUF6587 family protein n=1 Tax=Acinetobacter sp. B51(2017) TaxID=2060938 RepID=UPI000F094548|nr:DUF6587 family protein [Acinetobacter sp. B51(2017)]
MVEGLIIAVLVLWSTLVVFKKVFPKTSFKFFLSLANLAGKQGLPRLAKWLKPAMPAGCGGSCGCSADDEAETKKPTVQAVKWK